MIVKSIQIVVWITWNLIRWRGCIAHDEMDIMKALAIQLVQFNLQAEKV